MMLKRLIPLMSVLLLCVVLMPLGAQKAEASEYYYFKAPEAGASFTVGKKIPVSFYAGVTVKETKCDAWGRPTSTTYSTMPAAFKVFKDGREIYSADFLYTKPETIETDYTPTTVGTLELCIYGRNLGLDVVEMTLQQKIKIKVTKPKATKVKSIKPVIEVERAAKKEAQITCNNSLGFSMKIYRATAKNGTYKLVKTTTKDTYVDKKLSASKSYYYKVRLTAKSGKKTYYSKWSAKKKVSNKVASKLTLSYSASKGVKVSWKAMKGVGYYLVSRSATGAKAEYDVIACEGATTTAYYDKDVEKGKTYYYSVVGCKGNDDVVGKYMAASYKIKIPK